MSEATNKILDGLQNPTWITPDDSFKDKPMSEPTLESRVADLERRMNEMVKPVVTIPYQTCPRCLGMGWVWKGIGTETRCCPVCHDKRVIPQYQIGGML